MDPYDSEPSDQQIESGFNLPPIERIDYAQRARDRARVDAAEAAERRRQFLERLNEERQWRDFNDHVRMQEQAEFHIANDPQRKSRKRIEDMSLEEEYDLHAELEDNADTLMFWRKDHIVSLDGSI